MNYSSLNYLKNDLLFKVTSVNWFKMNTLKIISQFLPVTSNIFYLLNRVHSYEDIVCYIRISNTILNCRKNTIDIISRCRSTAECLILQLISNVYQIYKTVKWAKVDLVHVYTVSEMIEKYMVRLSAWHIAHIVFYFPLVGLLTRNGPIDLSIKPVGLMPTLIPYPDSGPIVFAAISSMIYHYEYCKIIKRHKQIVINFDCKEHYFDVTQNQFIFNDNFSSQ